MVNYLLLDESVERSGLKRGYIAAVLGISRQALLLKLKGRTEFTASEISTLTRILKLSKKDRDNIFFASEVECDATY